MDEAEKRHATHDVNDIETAPVPEKKDDRASSESPPRVALVNDSGNLLIPQPSTSPDDPLNWSWRKKNTVLLALIPGCLLTDWTLTWGTTVFQLQAPEW